MNVHKCENCGDTLEVREYFEHDYRCHSHEGHAVCPLCGYCQDCCDIVNINKEELV